MSFFECMHNALTENHLPLSTIKPVQYNNEKVIRSIIDFAINKEDGQLNENCLLRRFNLVKMKLANNGRNLSLINDLERNELNSKQNQDKSDEIILENKKYYDEFLTEVLPMTSDFIWFIPSLASKKWLCYEGKTRSILAVISNCWTNIHEFYISAKDFSWLIYFDHQNYVYFLGDELTQKVKINSEQSKWKERIVDYKYYLSYTNGLESKG
ncbi:MAG: hypothetical protein JXA54_11875 [Candidatus Heimdallarchaeota archaeon]|nr:hypothetical protein [Candidatus Heimdallarchaeota archaeon]